MNQEAHRLKTMGSSLEKMKKVQTDQKTGAQAADPMTGAEALDPVYRRRCLLGSLSGVSAFCG